MNYATRKVLNSFIARPYQIPIVDALENKDYKKIVAIMPRRCIAAGTLITMADGSARPIEDIDIGDIILSFDGEQIIEDTIRDSWFCGKKDALEVSAIGFPSIVAGVEHKFYTGSGNWTKANDLESDDSVYQFKELPNINLPSKEEVLAEFIGFFTYGGVMRSRGNVSFTSKNPVVFKHVEQIIKKKFHCETVNTETNKGQTLRMIQGQAGGKTYKYELRKFFEDLHMLPSPAFKVMHDGVWKLSPSSVVKYLCAAIACCGEIKFNSNDVSCEIIISCGKSRKFAHDTYWLIRKIGFLPQFPVQAKSKHWSVTIGYTPDVVKILSAGILGKEFITKEILGILDNDLKVRQDILQDLSNSASLTEVPHFKTKKVDACDMYDIETRENSNFFANGYLVHNSGKDIVAWNLAIRQCIKKTCVVFYIFPTYAQAKKVIWNSITNDGRSFHDFIPKELIKSKNSQEMKITFINDSILQLIGSDNVDRLVGTNPYGCVFSEYAIQDPRAYQFLRPILVANNGWVLMCSTPRGKNHFYELYQIALESPDWFAYKLTLDDTQHIPYKEIERERAEGLMSEDLIQQEFFTSFSLGVEGAYYTKYLDRMRINNQIGNVPYEVGFKVHTAWDLGVRDSTAIIFFQTIGQTVRIIDCYENSKQGLEHYVKILEQRGYIYGKHIAPHDIRVKEFGSGMTRIEKAKQLGIKFVVASNIAIQDGVESVRSAFSKIWIDEEKCEQLLKAINNYRQEYDSKKRVYKANPLHDWSSHYADALRYLCISLPKTRDGHSTPEELDQRYREAAYGSQDLPSFFR